MTALVRRLLAMLTASDPGRQRLRMAGTTLATLVVALGVLYDLAKVSGQPITVALLGVVLAMIASIAVRDPEPGRHGISTLLLVPPAAAAVTLGAVLGPYPVISDVVFVAIMVSAVFLRLLGPRGTAMGMVAFVSYFFALFLRATPAQLPALIVALVVGALVSLLMRALLQQRHPARELRGMLSALAIRAGAVLDTLARAMRAGRLDATRRRRLRARLALAGDAALMIEGRLDSADEPLLDTVGNEELSIRIFDFQLSIEHLVSVAVPLLDGDAESLPAAARSELGGTLDAMRSALQGNADRGGELAQVAARLAADDPAADTGQQSDRLRRALRHAVDSWRHMVEPQAESDARPDDADESPAEKEDEPEDDKGGGRSATARQAVQVGVATALAIVVGELLSPTRWFWAVIAAFVVFVGTSTRGETLSKGWQRVLGTLLGVGAGVVVAALVGGNTIAAVVLIGACLFLGFYLVLISSGIMIFFITTVLALLYGLLGQFSVGLLMVRLEETAAGAAIGVLVSYLVLPSSTRDAVAEALDEFLGDLGELLSRTTATLTGETPAEVSAPAEARALRDRFDALRRTAKPLSRGMAGLVGRSDFRRVLRFIGACEHHARSLAQLAGAAPGPLREPRSDGPWSARPGRFATTSTPSPTGSAAGHRR